MSVPSRKGQLERFVITQFVKRVSQLISEQLELRRQFGKFVAVFEFSL